jgi:hypothetical protein
VSETEAGRALAEGAVLTFGAEAAELAAGAFALLPAVWSVHDAAEIKRMSAANIFHRRMTVFSLQGRDSGRSIFPRGIYVLRRG